MKVQSNQQISSRWLVAAALALIMLLTAMPAWAQNGQGIERLRAELERTDEVIALAREAVLTANDAVADRSLQSAIKLQEEAWDFFDSENYLISSRLTKQARQAATAAISRSRRSEQFEGGVQRRLELAGELLQRAEDAVDQNPTLQTLLSTARDNLARGWEFYRNQQYRPALKLADQVEKAAKQIIRLGNAQGQEKLRFNRNREQATVFMAQTSERLAGCRSDLAEQLMEQARKALDLADELAGRDRYVAANQALRQVRDLTWQAARECQGSDQLTARYERLIGEADRLADELVDAAGTQADAARELLEQAYSQLDLAREYFRDNQTEAARAALQAAQLALRQAQRYITSGN
ncbi:hypothetical protein GF377_05675 [candidate division GN15 bacterium]|nr:hypothetical protein [candidate division GN15 bacterium]